MFCKWCGSTMDPADRSCRKCGREIPPLSDCGGFYDLVGGARQNQWTPAVQPQQPPRVDLAGVEEQIKRVAGHSRRSIRGVRMIMFCGFALALVLLTVLWIQNLALLGRVAELEKALPTQVQEAEPSTVPEEMDFTQENTTDHGSPSQEDATDVEAYPDSIAPDAE